ncbi:MAG: hypothetical protein WC874_00175 [Candidatus Izemoplasmatales bacterium]|jgi:hypothetical protein
MKQKGQTNFEALILLLLVISSAIFISALYFQTHDITIATAIARNDILKQLNSIDEQIEIESVKVTVNSLKDANINIKTSPETVYSSNLDSEKLAETAAKIKSDTSFNHILIKINDN